LGVIVDEQMNNSPSRPAWTLHPQLAHDTVTVTDLPLSRLLLSHDANYPWLLLVPRRPGATEIIDLDAAEQAQLMTEIDAVSRALAAVTACDKLNVAAIGNMVPAPRPCGGAASRRSGLAEAGMGRRAGAPLR
jgi:diadenosine tetraphosphate (Ap4A) HIT family hydrolase